MKNTYTSEGSLLGTKGNREYIGSKAGLFRAMCEGKILEGTALLCDSRMRLHVDLGDMVGIIDKSEAVYNYDGKQTKDIAVITRVGKPVCFKVMGFAVEDGKEIAILSRRAAQQECLDTYLDELRSGDIIEAKVTHLDNFGAFVDIGCGIASLLSIDCISVSRISHPSDRLRVGEQIYTVIKSIDRDSGRIFVSMRELLGTWEQNAAQFEVGQTVAGIIRSIESYGVFVELAPNLAGLAEIREGSSDADVAKVGEYAAVYIKSILPDRMKIKLVLIDSYHGATPSPQIKYFVDCKATSHIDTWRYSPSCSHKVIESNFE
jgi:small subunit ribosomal protein S1